MHKQLVVSFRHFHSVQFNMVVAGHDGLWHPNFACFRNSERTLFIAHAAAEQHEWMLLCTKHIFVGISQRAETMISSRDIARRSSILFHVDLQRSDDRS